MANPLPTWPMSRSKWKRNLKLKKRIQNWRFSFMNWMLNFVEENIFVLINFLDKWFDTANVGRFTIRSRFITTQSHLITIVKILDILNGNSDNNFCKLPNGLSMSRVNIKFSAFTLIFTILCDSVIINLDLVTDNVSLIEPNAKIFLKNKINILWWVISAGKTSRSINVKDFIVIEGIIFPRMLHQIGFYFE